MRAHAAQVAQKMPKQPTTIKLSASALTRASSLLLAYHSAIPRTKNAEKAVKKNTTAISFKAARI